MNREQLIQEIDRLLELLGTLDPTTPEYQSVCMRLYGTGGKGGSSGLFGMLIALDTSAQDLNDKERSIDLEARKVSIEERKLEIEEMKFQEQQKVEARKLDIEEEKVRNDKEVNDRKNATEEWRVEIEAKEAENRVHFTKAEARRRLVEIGAETLGIAALIGLTGRIQNSGLILDKTMVGFLPKFRKF